jgi:Ca2+-binding EF-hand superfamily protein
MINHCINCIRMLSEEEAGEKFEDVDEDKDGKITWEEHLQDTYGGTDVNELKRHEANVKVWF